MTKPSGRRRWRKDRKSKANPDKTNNKQLGKKASSLQENHRQEKPRIAFFFDLIIILIFTFLNYVFVLVPPYNETVFRIPFSLPLLLFIPGYMLIAAMFPKKDELSAIERFTLSVGLAIAIFVFDGFAISVTPWRFRPNSIVLSLIGITLLLMLFTVISRKLTPAERRYLIYFPLLDKEWSRRKKILYALSVFGIASGIAAMLYFKLELAAGIWMFALALMLLKNPINSLISILKADEEPSDIERALIYALVGSIIIASGMLIYAKLTFQEERFTALYILGKEGKAENYPSELFILEPNPIIVGVENYEHAPMNYTLKIFLGKYLLLEKKISLKHNEKWQEKVDLIPKNLGKRMKLSFQLFKDGSEAVYREVHLWVDSVIDYNNILPVREFSLKQLPELSNPEMNYAGGWKFESNSNLFRGFYTVNSPKENTTLCGNVFDDYGKSVNAQITIDNRYGYRKTFRAENGSFSVLVIPDHFFVSVSARGYKRANFEVETPSPCFNVTLITAVNKTIREVVETPQFSIKLNEALKELNQTLVNQTLGIADVSELSLLEKLKLINATIHRFSPDEYPHLISLLKGYVIDKINNQPIENATIRVVNEYGFVQKARSDKNGYYEVRVISGNATVEVSAYGYALTRYSIRIASVHEVDLKLVPRSCILKGFVLDDRGDPIPDAYLSIRAESFSTSTTSNQSGYFEVRTIPGNNSISISKPGYERSSAELSLKPNEVKELVMKIKRIAPKTPVMGKVKGTLTFKGIPVSGTVVAERLKRIEKNGSIEFAPLKKVVERVEAEGTFELSLEPGYYKIYYEPEIYCTPVILKVEGAKEVNLNIELNAIPDSFMMIYPAGKMPKGAFAGIYQEFNSNEGLAALAFRVYDSYVAERETKVFKQVLLNGVVVWEDDVGGNEGWEEHVIPVTLENGTNRLELRVYAKGEASGIISVRWDEIRILPLEEVLKDKTTKFDVEGIENGERLVLGKPKDVLVTVSNREFEKLRYELEIRVDGFILHNETFILDHNESVKRSVRFIPNIVSNLNRIDFNLYARGELYQKRSFWVSTEADFTNELYLENVRVETPELPGFKNWGYSYNGNFSVKIDEYFEMKAIGPLEAFNSSSCWIKFNLTPPANFVVSFKVRDDYNQDDLGLKKQLLFNGKVVWEDDVGEAEGWQYIKIPVTSTSKENLIMLRVYAEREVREGITVLWKDVKLMPITELRRERVTTFLVLNSEKEEKYPEQLYLGKPETFWVVVENHEFENVSYLFEARLDDRLVDQYSFNLTHLGRMEREVRVEAEELSDLNRLDFILYKITDEGRERIGIHRFWLPSVIDLTDREVLEKLSLEEVPSLVNGDFEDQGGWLQEERGNFIFMRYETERGYVYSIFPFISVSANESGYILQKVRFPAKGVVLLNFSVSDSYASSEQTGIVKRILINGRVVWEDDIAGDEGWQTIKLPVYIDTSVAELKLGMFAYNDSEIVAKVFFDNVSFEKLGGD
jgi:uncharacterized membrane protein